MKSKTFTVVAHLNCSFGHDWSKWYERSILERNFFNSHDIPVLTRECKNCGWKEYIKAKLK